MWMLLIVVIFELIVIIERLIVYIKASRSAKKFFVEFKSHLVQGNVDEAVEICEATPGPVPSIMRAGLLKYQQTDGDMDEVEKAIDQTSETELSFLEKGLTFLQTGFTISPMIGFLGTVVGMIHAFDAIAMAGSVEATVVASGISEALITTASGLAVAIPISLAYNYFTSKVNSIILSIEESTREFIDILKSQS
ncbi:MAG TPA: MotA/TolQ/ExbB proton channel family protein [Candidatus Mcinerneyibacterium sp.]|nr:MotA/TolQ/ExbB proton channel family protein [Candidatus Mcinerneyibacterium sp.]